MGWHLLDPSLYAGPVVRAVVRPARGHHPARPDGLTCWALLDTGATHTVVDAARVARCLSLVAHDRRRTLLAEHGPVDLPVHEVGIRFPDFPFPERQARVTASRLPGPFWVLVGMDLLDGTRLELDVRGEQRWMRWRPVG